MSDRVELTYPGVQNSIHVRPERVAQYEARGWRRADKPYAKWRKADLEAEVARRNAERDEADQLPTSGTVAELAAALEADDA